MQAPKTQQRAFVLSSVSGDLKSFVDILQLCNMARVEHHPNEAIDKKVCVWTAPENTLLVLCGNVISSKNVLLQDLQLVRCIVSLQRQAEKKKSKVVWLLGNNETGLLDKRREECTSHEVEVKEIMHEYHRSHPACAFCSGIWFFCSHARPPPSSSLGTWNRVLQEQIEAAQKNLPSGVCKVDGDVFAFPSNGTVVAENHASGNYPRAPRVSKGSSSHTNLQFSETVSHLVQEDKSSKTISADVLKHYPTNPHTVRDSYRTTLNSLRDVIFSLRPSFMVISDVVKEDVEFWVLQ